MIHEEILPSNISACKLSIHEINWNMVDKEIIEALDAPKPKRKYVYSKEKVAEYNKKSYLKNKEKLIANTTEWVKNKYNTDPEYKQKRIEYSREYRKKQKELLEEAKKIINNNLVLPEKVLS